MSRRSNPLSWGSGVRRPPFFVFRLLFPIKKGVWGSTATLWNFGSLRYESTLDAFQITLETIFAKMALPALITMPFCAVRKLHFDIKKAAHFPPEEKRWHVIAAIVIYAINFPIAVARWMVDVETISSGENLFFYPLVIFPFRRPREQLRVSFENA